MPEQGALRWARESPYWDGVAQRPQARAWRVHAGQPWPLLEQEAERLRPRRPLAAVEHLEANWEA